MNTQRLRAVSPVSAEPAASPTPEPVASPVVPAPVIPVGAPAPDASLQQTGIMLLEDLEEFRQAARAASDIEADRVTPTGLLVSPFAHLLDPPLPSDAIPAHERPLEPAAREAARPGREIASQAAAPVGSIAPESGIARSFREASWPKRLTVLLLPVVIGLYGLKAFRHRTPVLQPANRAGTVASASASVAPAAARAGVAANAGAPVVASALPASAADGHGPSLQRRAVDAYATGSFPEAAALYQRLFAEHPERPEFAVAAQIAADKAKGGQHE